MRVKIGDIIEIKTSKGFAYAVYSHRHADPPVYGALIRVFEPIFEQPTVDLGSLALAPIRFSTFFPLQAAVNRRIVRIVGNIPVPEALQAFPIFRGGTVDPRIKRVAVWYLWDGKKQWRVGELTAEMRRLPLEGIWNDTMLIRKIESDWRPETDSR